MKAKRVVLPSARVGKLRRKDIEVVVKGVHVAPMSPKRWSVRCSGVIKGIKVFDDREDAVLFANSIGLPNKLHIIIHTVDGKITNVTASKLKRRNLA